MVATMVKFPEGVDREVTAKDKILINKAHTLVSKSRHLQLTAAVLAMDQVSQDGTPVKLEDRLDSSVTVDDGEGIAGVNLNPDELLRLPATITAVGLFA